MTKIQKYLAVALVLICLALIVPVQAEPLIGNGTQSDPYLIETTKDLYLFKDLLAGNNSQKYADKVYQLTSDLVLTDPCWEPIGSRDKPFTGVFDGAGHSVSGLTINDGDLRYAGFFGRVKGETENPAKVIDLHLKDVKILGGTYTGGISGALRNAKVSGCSVSGSIEGDNYVGGITGRLADSEIIESFADVQIRSGSGLVGGVVGYIHNGVLINSHASGTVTCDYPYCTSVGGLVGVSTGETLVLTDCYTTSDVFSNGNRVGGVIGWLDAENVYTKNCFATGAVEGNYYVGGLTGYLSECNSLYVENCDALNSEIKVTEGLSKSTGHSEKIYASALPNEFIWKCSSGKFSDTDADSGEVLILEPKDTLNKIPYAGLLEFP